MTTESMPRAMLELVQFDLTDECPLFCLHCSNSSGPKLRSALGYAAAEQAIADAEELGCRNFIFSGGEPLRYADLAGLLALCKDLGVATTIFTTGIHDTKTRLPMVVQEWARLKTLGLGTAIFSAYASPANRGFHNGVVRLRPIGMRDAFEANEVGILNAHNAGLSVELQFVPSDETCSELPSVIEWAAKLGVSKLHLLYPTSQGRNTGSASLTVSDNDELVLKEHALAFSREHSIALHISRLWCSKWGIPSKSSLQVQIIVRSDGVVVRCNACKYVVEPVSQENIYQQSLRQIWKDENWRNASCECSTQRVSQASASGRPSMHIVPADGLLATGTK
jgi:MoaA/NifB/PqqE/SkfB family radical SAM enzyme